MSWCTSWHAWPTQVTTFFRGGGQLRRATHPVALGQGHQPALLEAREPLAHRIAVHGIEGGQLTQREPATMTEHRLRPAALAGVATGGSRALQLLNLWDGQRNRCEFHSSNLLPAYF